MSDCTIVIVKQVRFVAHAKIHVFDSDSRNGDDVDQCAAACACDGTLTGTCASSFLL